jgi:hypothetical protein
MITVFMISLEGLIYKDTQNLKKIVNFVYKSLILNG